MNGVGAPRAALPAPENPLPANPAAGESRWRGSRICFCIRASLTTSTAGAPSIPISSSSIGVGDPFHHHQDLNRLRQAWQKPETIIVHESWWTPTARHADIVLPATTTLERNDVGGSSRDNFIIAMHRAIEPVGEARSDFDIYLALADRLGYGAAFGEQRSEMEWCRLIYERVRTGAARKNVALPAFDDFWREGFAELPPPDEDFVLFEEFRRAPDLHALKLVRTH